MQDHVVHKVKWRYLINVAGQSYPLRTPEEMVDILRIYNGANDIEGIYNRRIFSRYKRVTINTHVAVFHVFFWFAVGCL